MKSYIKNVLLAMTIGCFTQTHAMKEPDGPTWNAGWTALPKKSGLKRNNFDATDLNESRESFNAGMSMIADTLDRCLEAQIENLSEEKLYAYIKVRSGELEKGYKALALKLINAVNERQFGLVSMILGCGQIREALFSQNLGLFIGMVKLAAKKVESAKNDTDYADALKIRFMLIKSGPTQEGLTWWILQNKKVENE